jgi:MFS transporter, DHA1 family, tetracycline resistance protein
MGIAAAAGGLGWVLSASAWGRLSDRIGRRRVLLAGVAGFALSFAALCAVLQAGVSGLAASGVVLGGMIAARFAMGTLYSAVPSAGNALIADHHAPEARAGAMGRLGAAQAGGLLFGPAVVAIAAGASPVLPLALLGVLPLAAFAVMALRLAEAPAATGAARDAEGAPGRPSLGRRLLRPVAAAFAAMVAVSIAQIVVGFVALDRLGLPQAAAMRLAGISLAAVGVALIAAQVLVGRLNLPAPTLAVLGSVLSAAGFLAAAIAPGAMAFVAAYVLAGFGAGFIFPAISALAANAVGPEAQGRAAGAVTTSFGSAP